MSLDQNYPNPFGPASSATTVLTAVTFRLPAAGRVSLRVYNLLGKEVATLVNDYKQAGNYTVTWNAAGMPAGLYIYRLETNGSVLTRKMTFLK
ncbi:MAG: T9SS type A sorting domain-containing protein [Chlorobi bacterium]|nr:T9SS type A sorting domain-containing protein [Chlorobiota bacterium]